MGGGLTKNFLLKPKYPPKLNLSNVCFKHGIQLFKVVSSLKVVKIYTKMYYHCKNFRGQMSGGGGTRDRLWSENGDECRMGRGLTKFSPTGGPQMHMNLSAISNIIL